MQIEIDLHFKSKKWPKDSISQKKTMFSKIALKALEAIKATKLCRILNFSMAFISDTTMKKHNLKFRNKTQTTNVLAFPAEEFLKSDLKKFKMEYLYLGEIIFSFETIIKESKQQNKSFEDHLLHLFLHGFLHLLCYVHDNAKNRESMEKLEILILKNFGIKNPYEPIL